MKSDTGCLVRTVTALVLLSLVPALAFAAPLQLYVNQGREVDITRSEFQVGGNYTIFDISVGEAVTHTVGNTSVTAVNVALVLQGQDGYGGNFFYFFFGPTTSLAVSFASPVTSDVVPSAVSIQGSVQACSYPTDCVDITVNATVTKVGQEVDSMVTSRSSDGITITSDQFDGHTTAAHPHGTITVTGGAYPLTSPCSWTLPIQTPCIPSRACPRRNNIPA